MNKQDLHDAVAARLGVGLREAAQAVDAVLHVIQEAVAGGEKVTVTGFGVFEKVVRPARTGRNPATGVPVDIAETAVPKFRAGTTFKDKVAGR